MVDENSSPNLQAPGAGLPWVELTVARYVIFPLVCRQPWEKANRVFQNEGERVLAVWDALSADQLTQKVLTPRFAGMEDSSRHWSAAMTVEHLVMVGSAVCQVIEQLRAGKIPPMTARIADFKPKGEIAPAEVRSQFTRLLAQAGAQPPIPRGHGPRFEHPWFGPLDAHQWKCLLGFHQGVHRKQIEAIRNGLAR